MHHASMMDGGQASVSRVLILRSEKADGDLEKRVAHLGYFSAGTHGIYENIDGIIEQQESITVILDLVSDDLNTGLDVADTVLNQYGLAVLFILDSEKKYRGIFESASVGIFRSARSGTFIDVNPYVVHMLGYESREELLSSINPAGLDKGLYKYGRDRPGILKDVEVRKSWYRYQAEFLKKHGQIIACRVAIRVFLNRIPWPLTW